MVDYNLIAQISLDDSEVDALVREAYGDNVVEGDMDRLLKGDIQNFAPGTILKGRVVGKAGDDAVIEVGLKSEGLVNKNEFDDFDALEAGEEIEVLLEALED